MNKNGISLVEVMLATFLVSLISVFLFRGYHSFVKTLKKSENYFQVATVSEQVIWDLRFKMLTDKESFDFADSPQEIIASDIDIASTVFNNCKAHVIKCRDVRKDKVIFDTKTFLLVSNEQ